jgi:hypothetical protein
MANKTPMNSIYEFHDELIALLVRCDLHKPDVASALVAAAVGLPPSMAAIRNCKGRVLKSLPRTLSSNCFAAAIQLTLCTDKRISPALALSGWPWSE